jgi:hypothetical protein
MNTEIHSPALFLHPLTQKLAISQAASGHSFQFMVQASLKIAHQWRWSQEKASCLVEDLKQYYHCKGPFMGGQADGLDWWESLPIKPASHPLQSLAIILLSVVPHSADVERLCSALRGTQTPKRCNISVDTFETLGKLCANYSYHLYQRDRAAGKSTHHRHNHMHTCAIKGINVELAEEVESTFSYVSPLAVSSKPDDDFFDNPEDFSLNKLEKEFDEFEKELNKEALPDADGAEVLNGEVHNFEELDWIDQGEVPGWQDVEMVAVDNHSGTQTTWNVEGLMSMKGMAA